MRRPLSDGYFLAAALEALGVDVTPDQIRQWAARGHVRRYGRDTCGRTLYDWDEVHGHATRHADDSAA